LKNVWETPRKKTKNDLYSIKDHFKLDENLFDANNINIKKEAINTKKNSNKK